MFFMSESTGDSHSHKSASIVGVDLPGGGGSEAAGVKDCSQTKQTHTNYPLGKNRTIETSCFKARDSRDLEIRFSGADFPLPGSYFKSSAKMIEKC